MDEKKDEFVTKDSGRREEFEGGMVRDVQDGKPRYDLIQVGPLTRYANLLERGAKKYGERNWEIGQRFSRAYSSLLRHVYAWALRDASEDHLAAVVFNTFALMFYEEKVQAGEMPDRYADMGPMHVAKGPARPFCGYEGKHKDQTCREREVSKRLREEFKKIGFPQTCSMPDEGTRKLVNEVQEASLTVPLVVYASPSVKLWPCLTNNGALKDDSGGIY